MSFETISVIGLGYIGLPTAAMFASRKKKVIGVDLCQHVVETINQGKIHIVEPDLDMIVSAAVTQGYLKAVTTPEPADAFLIAVPTPFKPAQEDEIPEPDLGYIHNAVEAIAPVLKKGDLVILESTSPVGTTQQMADWLAMYREDLTFPQQADEFADVNVAHCPERVLPGKVVTELVQNDRVIGGMTKHCSERSIELYKTFVMGECFVTNSRTAEMVKITENSSRDVQIAFANELSMICDKLDINVWELINLANRHPRVDILKPGPGVGGHCIAVDPWFIVSKTPEQARLIHTARNVNDSKPQWVINRVESAVQDFLSLNPNKSEKDVTIACYGLTFKPDIDDLRESPALAIAKEISINHEGAVLAIEPNIQSKIVEDIRVVTIDESLTKTDIHVMLVDHKQFRKIKLNDVFVIDTRGIW